MRVVIFGLFFLVFIVTCSAYQIGIKRGKAEAGQRCIAKLAAHFGVKNAGM